MEYRLMPDPLDSRENTFTNLLLLGFRPDIYEAKHKCPFNRDAFVFPNKKAMEAVFHFLFTKLNPDVARDEFRNCWPILDKKHESAFRKVAAGWLNRIRKESHDSHLPRIVASVLMSPGGDKFYQLLFYFSSYVLKEELKKVLGKYEIVLPWPSDAPATKSMVNQMSKVLRTKVTVETKRCLQVASLSNTAQDQWVLYASELTKENRSLRKKKREVEKSFKELEAEHLQRGLLSPAPSRIAPGGSPYAGQIKSLKRTKIVQRVREFWTRLEELYQSHGILREKIGEILHGTGKKFSLKSCDIDIKTNCSEGLHLILIYTVLVEDCLVQLLNLSLHLVLEQVRSHPLPSLSEEESSVRQKLHALSAYVESARSLKDILEVEMVPELKDSIEELKENIEMSATITKPRTPKTTNNIFDLGLTGLPATPSVQLKADAESENEKQAFIKQLFTDSNANTPEAIEGLMQSLRDATTVVTPCSNGKFDASIKPPQPKTDGRPKVSQKSYPKARIPIAKSKSTSRPRRLVASKGDVVRLSKMEDVASKIEEKQVTKPKENTLMESKADKSNFDADNSLTGKAREILADKVASFVLQQRDASSQSSSSSSSSRSATPLEHGLADPISAMAEDAFEHKDKIARTPIKKEKAPKQGSVDLLESYLISSSLHIEGTPNTRTMLFPDSATNTPFTGESLFDTPLHNTAPRGVPQGSMQGTDGKMFSRGAILDPESPLFDAFLQTPLVSKAIRSSVASSIMNSDDEHTISFSGDRNEANSTPRPARVNATTRLDFDTPVSHIARETSRITSLLSTPLETDPDTREISTFSAKNGQGNAARPSPLEISFIREEKCPRNVNPTKTEGEDAKYELLGGRKGERPEEKRENDNLNNKEHLNSLIERFKNLKANSKKLQDYREPNTPNHSGRPHFSDLRNTHADDVYEHRNDQKQTWISLNDENLVSAHSSFIDMARESATRDAVTWADLKNSFTSEEPEKENETAQHQKLDADDSFEDLSIPVAHQLSFLQLDTRDLSADNKLDHSVSQYRDPGITNSSKPSQYERTNPESKAPGLENNLSFESPFVSRTSFENGFPQLTQKRDDFGTLFNTCATTPMSKALDDDDFNLLTPGFDLRRRIEMFSFDVGSPGTGGEQLGHRDEGPSPITNLIDFN
eukprot:gene6197-11601_t